ncbi:MAG: hypothetical protein O3C40_26975 [Planctomycetota bacterium]|nr:hypothetical protein [Planctomycetota bacterium]
MKTSIEHEIIDIVDEEELLLLFQQYVANCIEDSRPSSIIHPIGFDDWVETDFRRSRSERTVVVTVTLTWEEAAGGYLCGGASQDYRIRIPAEMLTDEGGILDDVGLRRVCKKFAHRMNRRLPSVVYRGKRAYSWTWS